MKKIFKYGCGCLGVVIGLIILLLIIAVSCDSDSSVDQKKISQNNDSGEWFDGVDPKIDSQLKWEKKCPQGFLQESARKHVKNFLEQQGIKQGHDTSSNICCYIVDLGFTEREYRYIQLYKKQIELKAFMWYLDALSKYLNENTEVSKDSIQSTSSMKWGDFDFSCVAIATGTSFSKELVLSKNGSKLITYTVNSKGERFNMPQMMIRGIAAYDELIRNFLKYHPGAVKLEYSAWSWDEKNKQGEFALALVLDISSFKR
ncbi:MAG: hypothetical protein IKB71_00115 [Lentisphaeria bacterium]|nr:hypothetical protein [Lentisphaeria bacterium]